MKNFREYLTPLAVLLMTLVMAYDHLSPAAKPAPHPVPSPSFRSIGHTHAIAIASAYASAWDVAASQVLDGKPISTIQTDLQIAWKTARIAAFKAQVEPGLAAILPAGTEPDPSTRPAVSKAFREFAAGLRSIK